MGFGVVDVATVTEWVVFVFGLLTLDVLYGNDIAIFVIGIGLAELLLIQLDAVKVDGIDIIIICQLDTDGGIVPGGDERRCGILPCDVAEGIGVKVDSNAVDDLCFPLPCFLFLGLAALIRKGQCIALGIQEGGDDAEAPASEDLRPPTPMKMVCILLRRGSITTRIMR